MMDHCLRANQQLVLAQRNASVLCTKTGTYIEITQWIILPLLHWVKIVLYGNMRDSCIGVHVVCFS